MENHILKKCLTHTDNLHTPHHTATPLRGERGGRGKRVVLMCSGCGKTRRKTTSKLAKIRKEGGEEVWSEIKTWNMCKKCHNAEMGRGSEREIGANRCEEVLRRGTERWIGNGSESEEVVERTFPPQTKVDQIANFPYSTPTTEHRTLLTSKKCYNDAWKDLNNDFQQLAPYTQVVALPGVNIDRFKKPNVNELFIVNETNTLIFLPLEDCQCHNNCKFLQNYENSLTVFTGFALSDDGLWRFHSWCLTKDDTIIETTEPRIMYYGVRNYKWRRTRLTGL